MIGYMRAEFAKLWDISLSQIKYLCKTSRTDGAIKLGTTCIISEKIREEKSHEKIIAINQTL